MKNRLPQLRNRGLLRTGSYYPKVLMIVSLFIAAPLLVLPFYPHEAAEARAFLYPALFTAAIAVLTSLLAKEKPELAPYEWQSPLQRSSLPVLFAWLVAIIGGAAPFYISGRLGFVHSLFESVSAWTTAGLSVSQVEALPRIFLFHRAFMQFFGGLGFIIVFGVLIGGRQMMTMYSAEGHPGGIQTNLKRTSGAIILIYSSCLTVGTVLYHVFGMPFFEALCHAMTAISTAGFSTHVQSIGYYNSVGIEIVTIFLMLIGSTNFAVLLLLARRKFRRVSKISEVRFLGWVLLIFVPLTMFSLIAHSEMGLLSGLRHSVFEVVSVLSTTGFHTFNYSALPSFSLGLSLLLMILGGAAGSTAGGIKLIRAYILIRVTKTNFRRRVSPSHRVTIMRYGTPQGEEKIDDALVRDALEFITVYVAIIFIGTLLIAHFEDAALMDALYEFISVFCTVGLTNGLTAVASTPTLIVEMLGMILGRLEIFIVFIGIFAAFDRIRDRITKKSLQ